MVDRFLERMGRARPYIDAQLETVLRVLRALDRPVRRVLDVGAGDGFLASAVLAAFPTFAVLIGVMMVRRIGEYSITRPSRDALYTVVTREEKYKAKSLIDTFVYRGGDATAASVHALVKSTFGLGVSGVAWCGAAIAAAWALVAWTLGGRHADLSRRD
jgi:ATP/ADP translocase